jgi:hypothetical protein
VHGEVDFGATGEVLDVAVSSVLGTALVKPLRLCPWGFGGKVYTHGDRPCAFFGDLGFEVFVRTASMDILRFRGLCDIAAPGVRSDKFAFTTIPLGKNLG